MQFANRACVLAVIAGISAAVVSCASPDERTGGRSVTVTPPPMSAIEPLSYPGLHNVVAYHDGYYSGSAPEGDAAFETLAAMGVKTIITVDGAEPEIEKARARGMRYIHLPITYSGFDEARKLELVRATRDAIAEGPVYIHCHHGKHRSAGAAGAVAVSLGWMTPEEAVARMKVSGTAPNYKGLYECTAASDVIPASRVDSIPGTFPEVSRPGGIVKSMVEIDAAFENLKAIEHAAWKTPDEHPALVPAAEAGRLADSLRYLQDEPRVKREPVDFQTMLGENQARAQRLEDMILAGTSDAKALSEQFRLVAASCKDCHAKYRD